MTPDEVREAIRENRMGDYITEKVKIFKDGDRITVEFPDWYGTLPEDLQTDVHRCFNDAVKNNINAIKKHVSDEKQGMTHRIDRWYEMLSHVKQK